MGEPAGLSGRCLCGEIRYRTGPALDSATWCHCESCRRASGASAVPWVTVGISTFACASGTPTVCASSPGVRRQFCGRCGAQISYWCADRPDEIDITVGTLDDPELAPPSDHIWLEDAPSWDAPRDGLPCHQRTR